MVQRGNTTQISMLETEIAKLQRTLDTARIGYHAMQRQYQDQQAASETLRNALRAKEAEVQHAADVAAAHLAEARRHAAAREAADAQAAQLEDELAVAHGDWKEVRAQRPNSRGEPLSGPQTTEVWIGTEYTEHKERREYFGRLRQKPTWT